MLAFEYGVNTGNRFLQFVDHDEEPEAFIAAQTKPEDLPKKSATKDSKTTTTTKKVTSKTTTTATSAAAVTSTKTNKENLTSKSTSVDQRRQQSANAPAVFSDNNNQQARGDSARGARGGLRRGAAAGGAPFDGASRGRSQRFNKFEGQQGPAANNESSSFDPTGEGWTTEGARGRGRGGPRRGNFEGTRGTAGGGARGRGRGGRGNFNNRSSEEGGQQENNGWQQSAESNYDATRSQPTRDYDQEVSPQERPFEADNTRRGGRGNYRGRYNSNRTFSDREGGEAGQEDYRANRRLHDRQPRTNLSGVKPIEKKDGEGAHNWGNPTENPEEHPLPDETTETTGQEAGVSKDWAQQVDEAEKQMTLDEYKKQIEAKKRAQTEKLPQFKTRTAGEGEDPKAWEKPAEVYRKKNNADESEDDEEEEVSGVEENESEEDLEEEQSGGKKKLIVIPLHFKPIDVPRGASRGGQRRGGNPRYRDRPPRDEQGTATSPNQEQQGTASYPADDSQTSYRGGQRGGRGEYRRSYGNSARGSRQGRSHADPNAPALDNPDDFPTLPKQ